MEKLHDIKNENEHVGNKRKKSENKSLFITKFLDGNLIIIRKENWLAKDLKLMSKLF